MSPTTDGDLTCARSEKKYDACDSPQKHGLLPCSSRTTSELQIQPYGVGDGAAHRAVSVVGRPSRALDAVERVAARHGDGGERALGARSAFEEAVVTVVGAAAIAKFMSDGRPPLVVGLSAAVGRVPMLWRRGDDRRRRRWPAAVGAAQRRKVVDDDDGRG